MEKEKNTTENAIPLNESWEAYFVDKKFGWMLRCTEHPEKSRAHKFSGGTAFIECSCVAPPEAWKKLIFLDKLSKM